MDDPLDNMIGINRTDSVGEVVFSKSQIGVIHIGYEIFDLSSFPDGNRGKIFFRIPLLPAGKHVDGLTGDEVQDDQGVFAVTDRFGMDFIDTDDF